MNEEKLRQLETEMREVAEEKDRQGEGMAAVTTGYWADRLEELLNDE